LPISVVLYTILLLATSFLFLKSLADEDGRNGISGATIEPLNDVKSSDDYQIEIPKSDTEKQSKFDFEKKDESISENNLNQQKLNENYLQGNLKTIENNEFFVNQIEFVSRLDSIGKRWDFYVSNFYGNHITLTEKVAPLLREINSLISQPTAKASYWYCTIISINEKSFLCKYKSYEFSVEMDPYARANLQNLKNGAIVSFSGVLMSPKFEIFEIEDWKSSKPLIKIVNATSSE
jgi:hypothetical protein